MSFNLNIRSAAVTTLLLSAFFTGCSSDNTPKPPQPGTAAFQWATAKQAFEKGDFTKANALLVQLSQGKSEFAEQARPMALMTSIGMATSYMELAEKFAEGAKRTRGDAAPYMRSTNVYKSQATASGMQLIEEARRFIDANKDKEVTLALAAPAAGEKDDPPQYKKITAGQTVPAAEIAGMEKALIAKYVAKAMADAGATTADAKVPGPKFLLAVSKGLFAVSEMFGPKKLLQPTRIIEATHAEALEALALVKDSKEARELEKKVTAAKKKLAAT